MGGGKAHGENRGYQVRCRDVLVFRSERGLKPYADDGIDVPLTCGDTIWTFDIALRASDGAVILAECRRIAESVKQEDVAAFAWKVERAREVLGVPVSGCFFTKKGHQIGAVKVGAFSGIEIVVLCEEAAPPGFPIIFLRYDEERNEKLREIVFHVPQSAANAMISDVDLRVTRADDGGGRGTPH